MFSLDELRAVPLFAAVPADDLMRVAGEAADVRLAPGEYAVHEGDPVALFAVMAGRIEVTKLFDGVERVIGARTVGQIFGEIPIAFGIPYQGAYRATEPARVLRMEPRHYHALAAVSPEVPAMVGALARERIGGLQGFAAKPSKARALIVGHRWDVHCHSLRRFLERNQITFEWLTPDSPQFAAQWGEPVLRDEQLPALRCEDGTVLIRPTTRTLAQKVGLQTHPRSAEYDTVIVGGGPAGLAAAVYGASEGLRTIVLEREAPGGQAETSTRIENYLGFPTGVSGDELARRALQQSARLGAEMVVTREVVAIDPVARTVSLDGGEVLRTRTIILATGVSWRRLAIEGFDRLLGKGIYYGASRGEASMAHGLDVCLVGAGNSAGQAAMHFASHARSVTLVVRGDSLEKSMSRYLVDQLRTKVNISAALNTEVKAIHGERSLAAIDLLDRRSGAVTRRDCGGLFVFIGADAETGWMPEAIARDPRGYVLTGEDVVKARRWSADRDPWLLETSVPGIFACGDVRSSPVKRVASAVGEGSMAIAFVHQFLAQPERRT